VFAIVHVTKIDLQVLSLSFFLI